MVQQYGDQKKSCDALQMEVSNCAHEMNRLLGKQEKTEGNNAVLATAGILLFWPALFFMDLNDAEEEEYEAYRQRYNHLLIVSTDKDCGFEASRAPSIEEMKENAREEKRKKREEKRKARIEQWKKNKEDRKEKQEAESI